jgi:hypothetical protein
MGTPEAAAETVSNGREPKPASAAQIGLEDLRRRRRNETEALAQAAGEPIETIDALVGRVQSLSAAIDSIETAKGNSRSRRFAIAAVTGAVLLTGTLLLFHRPLAKVLLDTRASEVSFIVTTPFSPLSGVAGVITVDLAGLKKIRLEGAPESIAGSDEDLRLRVQTVIGTKNPGSLGFDSLLIPAGTLVEFTEATAEKSIQLRFRYPPEKAPTLDLDVTGDVVIHVNGQGQRNANFPSPSRITAVPAGDAQLVVQFDSKAETFPTPIPVESVLWSRAARTRASHPEGEREESSILSGNLSLQEFRKSLVNLRSGESVQLGGSSGHIRQLRMDGQGIYCEFEGVVSKLSIGEGSQRQNMMPTWLEWMRQRDALVQFWALVVYLAGLGLTLGRWWRESK